MDEWVNSEFAGVEFGDKRLNKRIKFIASKLSYAPGRTIPSAFTTWKEIKACYRFLSNERINPQKLLIPHIEQTINRIKEHPIVLLLADSSGLDYSSKISIEGKGRLSNSLEGIWIHPLMAVTPERLSLGNVDITFWQRGEKSEIHRDLQPIEEKESFRWLEGFRKAVEVAKECKETQIIYVADREADIVELIEEATHQKPEENSPDILIRVQHDRQLDEKDPNGTINRPYKKLVKTLTETKAIGSLSFTIPASHGIAARAVTQKLKKASLTFRTKKKNSPVRKVTINVVMAIEEGVPGGLCWIFLTTLPIDSFENVIKVINFYLCRWEIETFFKVLKSGCKVEERYLSSVDKMEVLIALFCVISWRIMYAMMLGRICPDMPCDQIFSEAEWKSVYKILNKKEKIPDEPPPLMRFIKMVATLGGYVDSKSAGVPGAKVMWRGMSRMMDFAIAWEAFVEK
jgi:transposase-like protein/transposase Tn5 family protein